MFLSIKNIPKVNWSSKESLNFKPKFSTSFFLIFGLTIFGLGEGLLILSTTGNSPWSVLAEGISLNSNLSIGAATFLVSVGVLFLWIFLKQKPGLGTIFNIIVIAAMIDFTLNYFQPPSSLFIKYLLAVLSVILVGLGSGIYLVANLGPGPRDGLMTGLTKTTNLPIALVRAFLEITVVIVGWYLGGTVGIGTLIFAFGIGPCVALGLFLVGKIFN
ncbi:membrane protein YczE [Candidatus Pelagibacter sp. HIMB1715]|uniref:membrane protein YczE n=1 Tax=Candidatus Pelagibacter sp. HIMB1715 TaxID=3413369 RepID=UPI003F871235